MSNPGDVYHIKGSARENHRHADYAERLLKLEAQQAELRAEWDEFITAMDAADDQPQDDVVIDPKDIHLTGYQGAAQHTYTPACDGFHEPGQCPRQETSGECSGNSDL